MTDPYDRMLAHLRWADREVAGALRRAPHAAGLELLAHIVGAEETWLARLERRTPRVPVWPHLTLDDTTALAEAVHAGLAEWLERADDAALDEEIAYTNSAGREFVTRASDMLLQLLLHGCYHRGQIAMLIRQGGSAPAPTDYIAWVRGVPAATRTTP